MSCKIDKNMKAVVRITMYLVIAVYHFFILQLKLIGDSLAGTSILPEEDKEDEQVEPEIEATFKCDMEDIEREALGEDIYGRTEACLDRVLTGYFNRSVIQVIICF
jgi:hypothetical protein